jgi:hypothetical protein
MRQSSTCLDLKVPHCVDMELTRFHSNLRARADKTFGPGGFDLAFQISLGAVLNSGCFSIRHSSGLWLPARLDSHGVSRRSVSRAGHAPGGPGQARARYSYCRTYCGLNRKRQSLGQWSEKLGREIRPRPRRDACAGQCSARAPCRLPEPESLLLLGKPGHAFHSFADLRGASIGIGPQGSGTGFLMRQLFEDPDLQELNVRLSQHELLEELWPNLGDGRLQAAAA